MLAGQRKLKLGSVELASTPILVPAFSSKGFPHVGNILEAVVSEVVVDQILVSAYDVYHENIRVPQDFVGLVFLDSGGYETGKDWEPLDRRHAVYSPSVWNRYCHKAVLDTWPTAVSTVAISYDHPRQRKPLHEQVKCASGLLAQPRQALAELLIKPEEDTEYYPSIDSCSDAMMVAIEKNAGLLSGFDVIGLTDKELGSNVRTRMLNIARVRRALQRACLDTPLHILGSLDTIVTPLYFLAGADVFDGLSWLRFLFVDGKATYLDPTGCAEFGIELEHDVIEAKAWASNIYYMADLELDMRRFLRSGRFDSFRHHSEFLERESRLIPGAM